MAQDKGSGSTHAMPPGSKPIKKMTKAQLSGLSVPPKMSGKIKEHGGNSGNILKK